MIEYIYVMVILATSRRKKKDRKRFSSTKDHDIWMLAWMNKDFGIMFL